MIRTVMESERARAMARKTRRAYSAIAFVLMVPLFVHGLWRLCRWIVS